MVLLEMFLIFFKIGAFTFGGGFAMIPMIQDEFVNKKGWIEEEKFIDAITLAQSSPGAIAVNLSIYTGYQVAGFPGVLVATLGTVLPSFLIIIIIARYLYQYRNHPILDKVFKGIAPAVVGLVISVVYNLLKTSKFGAFKLGISLITFLVIVFLGISPIYMIILGGLGAIIINRIRNDKEKID